MTQRVLVPGRSLPNHGSKILPRTAVFPLLQACQACSLKPTAKSVLSYYRPPPPNDVELPAPTQQSHPCNGRVINTYAFLLKHLSLSLVSPPRLNQKEILIPLPS